MSAGDINGVTVISSNFPDEEVAIVETAVQRFLQDVILDEHWNMNIEDPPRTQSETWLGTSIKEAPMPTWLIWAWWQQMTGSQRVT